MTSAPAELEATNDAVKKRATRWLWLTLIGATIVVALNGLAVGWIRERGSFGDMFGLSGALFSAFAFAALVYSLQMQRDELSLQRRDLTLQRELLQAQLEEIIDARKDQQASQAALKASADQQHLQSLFDLNGVLESHRLDLVRDHIGKVLQLGVTSAEQPAQSTAVYGSTPALYSSVNFLGFYFERINVLLDAWPAELARAIRFSIATVIGKDAAATWKSLELAADTIDTYYNMLPDDVMNRSARETARKTVDFLRVPRPDWKALGDGRHLA